METKTSAPNMYELDDLDSQDQPDPRTFRPELYAAASKNETKQVLAFLSGNVPCNYIDNRSGWTV